MQISIQKSKVFGKVKAPSSKSYTHRALILAALAKGKSKVISPLTSDDTEATLDCLRKIGVKIKKRKLFWEIEGGDFSPPKGSLFCRESGTTLRLMTSICALVKGKCYLTGESSLLRRPIKPLIDALKKLGVKCSSKGEFPPVTIENNLIGGKTRLPGNISSQFVSALLLIAPLAKREVEIELTAPLESKPYVLMTIESQKKFGVKVSYSKGLKKFSIKRQNYKPIKYFIEGDWSSAAPFLAAGTIAGRVEVTNLNPKSLQADREIINVLEKIGAKIKIKKNSIITEKSALKPIKVNIKDSPDLFPIICVLSTAAEGKSEISGIQRLKIKESNRIEEMRRGLTKMGIKNSLKGDRFFIKGGHPKGRMIDSTDHRIAMAFAILGLVAEGKTIIKNAECVSKSLPGFFDILKSLRRDRNIILIGYRGTGKTKVGKILAKRLKMPLISTDEMIIKKFGLSIPEIVKKYGWERFREVEAKIVKNVSDLENHIIDTGGGIILREENIKNLKENGIIFWLKADQKTIIKRIKNDNQRPALTDKKSFTEEVSEVLKERNPQYKKVADYIIDTCKFPVVEVANKIINISKKEIK